MCYFIVYLFRKCLMIGLQRPRYTPSMPSGNHSLYCSFYCAVFLCMTMESVITMLLNNNLFYHPAMVHSLRRQRNPQADFDPFDGIFGLAFYIDHPGNLILNNYFQVLPIAEQEAAWALVNPYETRRVSTFRELLLVNLNELRDVTLFAVFHLEHSYFHIY